MKASLPVFLFACLFLSTLFSCRKDDIDGGKPYYRLSNAAKEWITDVAPNDTLTFVSNLNHTVQYVVDGAITDKDNWTLYDSAHMQGTTYYLYDQYAMLAHRADSADDAFQVSIYGSVPRQSDATHPVPSAEGVVYAIYRLDDYIGTAPNGIYNDLTNLSQQPAFTSYTIGSQTLTDVLVFSCGCNAPLFDSSLNKWRTLTGFRYSKSKGLINFTSTSGEVWDRKW